MLKLDMYPLMHPLIHPWLGIKCMKSVDFCLGEKRRDMQRWRMTGRSDGGWGTPSRGWDRTELRTSNVCHSRKLMMPHSWAKHPPAACGKKDRHTERGLRVVLLSHGCSQKRWDALAGWGGGGAWGWKFKVQEYLWQSTPQLAPLSDLNEMNNIPPSSFFPITVLSPALISILYRVKLLIKVYENFC